MSFGTRRSDEGGTEPGALVMAGVVIAGLGTWAVGVGATMLVVKLLEAVGVCNVGAVEGAVAPAQLAKVNMSAVAPASDIAAYRRMHLTWTNSNEPTKAVVLKCHTRLRALVVVHAEAEAVVPPPEWLTDGLTAFVRDLLTVLDTDDAGGSREVHVRSEDPCSCGPSRVAQPERVRSGMGRLR